MIVPTNNKGKLEEIRKIFCDYEIYSLRDKGIDIDIIDDGNIFYDNTKKKVKKIYDRTIDGILDIKILMGGKHD